MSPRTGRVSVVVTCYNYGHYLEGCLESIAAQTYGDVEIIIVNDGSTDDTERVARGWSDRANVSYIAQANSGQANAKNAGIRRASGEFVAFLDADDLWDASKLDKQVALFGDPDVGVVYSRSLRIDERGTPVGPQPRPSYLVPRAGSVQEYLVFDNFVPFSSAVVRARCFEESGAFDESLPMAIDWDLWLRLSTRIDFAFVDEPLLLYRVGHAGQMSKNMELRYECCDRIISRFAATRPLPVSRRVLRAARRYSLAERGRYFESRSPARAIACYLRSIVLGPLYREPYKGLVRMLVRKPRTQAERTP